MLILLVFLGFGGQERIVLLGSLGEVTQVYFESDAIQAFDLKGSQGLANVFRRGGTRTLGACASGGVYAFGRVLIGRSYLVENGLGIAKVASSAHEVHLQEATFIRARSCSGLCRGCELSGTSRWKTLVESETRFLRLQSQELFRPLRWVFFAVDDERDGFDGACVDTLRRRENKLM